MKQGILLLKLELLNLFGINVFRYTKDPADKKRRSLLLACYLFLLIVLLFYLGSSAYMLGMFGLADRIPMLFSFLYSMMMLFIGAIRAKNVLYREKDLDLLAALPVKSISIASSRLLRMYVENTLLGIVVLLPGTVMYCIFSSPSMAYYPTLILTLMFLPLLPTTLCAWVGIVLARMIARNRHKVLTEVLLSMVLICGLFLLFSAMNARLGGVSSTGTETVRIGSVFQKNMADEEVIAALSGYVTKTMAELESSFPIVKTFVAVFSGNNIAGLLLFGLVSLTVFSLTAIFIGRNFFAITKNLYATGHSSHYQLTGLQKSSVMEALIKKEAGRYFSSGIYVTNTIIGPVMAAAFALALGFFDPESLLNGVEAFPIELHVRSGLPFMVGMIFAMVSISSSSISIEGKNWWIMQSLPLRPAEIFQAKLLFGIMVPAPFYLLAEIILMFTVQAGLLERLWFLLAPAVLILFSAVWGIFVNQKFPKFQWESDMEVVKQSAAVGIGMLGFLAGLLPTAVLIVLPKAATDLASLLLILAIAGAAWLLYRKVIGSALPS